MLNVGLLSSVSTFGIIDGTAKAMPLSLSSGGGRLSAENCEVWLPPGCSEESEMMFVKSSGVLRRKPS